MEIYVVKAGDTLGSIANRFGVSIEQLAYDNQLQYPYRLAVGQALLINQNVRQPDRTISVSGYAYPYIREDVLEQTLPYLSEIRVFSYGFTGTGELIPPGFGDDSRLINEAMQFKVRPILTLTPIGMNGNFDNRLINALVNSEQSIDNLIQNLLELMEEKGYEGVDIDFEYTLPADKDAYSRFVSRVADAMRANGYQTSVALAPKTSSNQRGILYEGMDYAALGEAADHVLLMTYEWGYTYGPPMAVAPLNQVRRVVEYALTQIPAAKIDLGIPNYGYDWPLPFVMGTTAADSISNIRAVELAVEHGAEIFYNEVAQSPYFNYTYEGVAHEVWFEDVRSLQGKFDLIKQYGLRGCGYWTIMSLFLANWLLLSNNFYIAKE